MRHFNAIWIPELSNTNMNSIFSQILKGHLSKKGGTSPLAKYAKPIIESTVNCYNLIRTNLKPSPIKSHYTFNLRDLSKVVQGLLKVKMKNLAS
jgi:dynein heavy chain